jgi:hypothetical protein
MNSRKRNNTREKKRSSGLIPKEVALLQRIADSSLQQQTRSVPRVPDIPFDRIRRDKPYTFMISAAKNPFTTSTSIEVDATYSFALADLGSSAFVTGLFDSYRIIAVNVQFIPTSGAAMNAGSIYTVIDYDDTTITSISALLQYETLQVMPTGSFLERTLEPRAAQALYSGAFSSFGQTFGGHKGPWIDTASTGVAYYGVKVGASASTTAQTYNVVATYVLQARNSK